MLTPEICNAMSIFKTVSCCSDCLKPFPLNAVKGRCARCYARHLRASKRVKALTCERCRGSFRSTRSDARFCSSACRQCAFRALTAATLGGAGQNFRAARSGTGGPPSYAKFRN